MLEKEHCDTCGIEWDMDKNEDFFKDATEDSFVFCEIHWVEFEKMEGQS